MGQTIFRTLKFQTTVMDVAAALTGMFLCAQINLVLDTRGKIKDTKDTKKKSYCLKRINISHILKMCNMCSTCSKILGRNKKQMILPPYRSICVCVSIHLFISAMVIGCFLLVGLRAPQKIVSLTNSTLFIWTRC